MSKQQNVNVNRCIELHKFALSHAAALWSQFEISTVSYFLTTTFYMHKLRQKSYKRKAKHLFPLQSTVLPHSKVTEF